MTEDLSNFVEPPSVQEVFRYALKNILTDYVADHPTLPFDPEDPDLTTLTDHRTNFGGNYSQLVARLSNRFDGTSFKANSDDHLTIDFLKEIINRSAASYPIVEVHPELYEYQAQKEDSAETYRTQSGHHQKKLMPILIPFSIEEGSVFYYDPFLDFYTEENTRRLSRRLFIELWGRCDITSWALWVDQGEQRTLMDIGGT